MKDPTQARQPAPFIGLAFARRPPTILVTKTAHFTAYLLVPLHSHSTTTALPHTHLLAIRGGGLVVGRSGYRISKREFATKQGLARTPRKQRTRFFCAVATGFLVQ